MKISFIISLLSIFWVFSGCSLLVEVKEPPADPVCGNGQIDHDEECDGSNLGGDSCQLHGFTGGQLGCTSYCVIITDGCTQEANCGNGTAEDPEQCDGEDLKGQSCQELGFDSGGLGCNADCTFNTFNCVGGNPCGNGNIDGGEQCDGGNLNGQTCQSQGYGDGELLCKEDCFFDTSNCTPPLCGNDVVEAGEQCDGGNLNGQTCQSLNWGSGNLTCTDNCFYDPDSCSGQAEICDDGLDNDADGLTDCGDPDCQTFCAGGCNNNVIEDGEDCDGTNVNGTTCWDWGFDASGFLVCNVTTCRMDFSNCVYTVGHPTPDLLTTGGAHTCGATSNAVFCWGSNQSGQLGTGSPLRYIPVPTSVYHQGTVQLGASSISAGGMHTCAVATNSGLNGQVLCWGSNGSGQLGVSGLSSSSTPVQVPGTRVYTAVSAGLEHTCAIALDTTVWCWGSNTRGQLGDGSGNDSTNPVQAFGLTGVVELSAGSHHTCAVKNVQNDENEIWCWGANESGQVGNNTLLDQGTPVAIQSWMRTVSCGRQHTCALDASDSLWCWGSNAEGQLAMAVGSTGSMTPNKYVGTQTFVSLTAGDNHNCAAAGPGPQVYCWGRNFNGQLGLGHTTQLNAPTSFNAFYNIYSISGGGEHTCALETDPTNNRFTYCWGDNWFGQLGSGTTQDRLTEEIVF